MTERLDAGPEELAISLSGPAIYANRFFVAFGPAGARIAFAEGLPNAPLTFRTGVLLSYPDAIALKDILADMLQPVESELAAARATPGTPENAE